MTELNTPQIAELVTSVASGVPVPDPRVLRSRSARRQRVRRTAVATFVGLVFLAGAALSIGNGKSIEVAQTAPPDSGSAPQPTQPAAILATECASILEPDGRWTDEMLGLCERLVESRDRSTPPVMSESQSQALKDVSFEQYEAAFFNFRTCLTRGEVDVMITHEPTRERPLWLYVFAATGSSPTIHDACYEWHYERIDSIWQDGIRRDDVPDGLATTCAENLAEGPAIDLHALRLCNRSIARVYDLGGSDDGDLVFSDQQSDALADGLVSADEYDTAFTALVECANGVGVAVVVSERPPDAAAYEYSVLSRPTTDVFFESCYEWHFLGIDQRWQIASLE